ncbi:hypothetical protein [Methylobacterium sp. WL19]|uniref:hypothetical protein n=1 Tax=Methylobacterium sp. WL19 TaxID=2603896 RepID=UPI0011CC01E1|nr:hypothetical protein [Methylobacterium sp. WL19]TXN33916.1 hypothetical protein FV220_00260 [Methylobacterium sp. WL19]
MTLTDKAASFARTETEEGAVGDVPEMIERVARALVLDYGGHPDQVLGFSSASAALWTFYVPAARAAIAAMREPNEALLGELHDKVRIEVRPEERGAYITNADAMWAAGIDAALGNPPAAR